MNYLFYSSELKYPTDTFNYSPSECYPEYPFSYHDLAKEPNLVYDAIRQMFHSMNLDEEHYGTKAWNPLGKWIKPNEKVVIKPNFVMHENRSNTPEDLDSLVTHPSIIRCILDYCKIALKDTGTIIVGDAPVKDCDFELLMKKRNYSCIEKFYRDNSTELYFYDFRGPEEGEYHHNIGKGILIDLGEKSWFYENSHNKNLLRIPNYDYTKVISHHCGKKQEYLLNDIILDADVIINLPKPKTHRKHGYTGALKNFIGASYSKEYLPHHKQGPVAQGGDEYRESGLLRNTASKLRTEIDKNRIRIDKKKRKADNMTFLTIYQKILWKLYNKIATYDKKWMDFQGKSLAEQAREGAWYGNDTLWRTVLDLNYCINYATSEGKLKDSEQRKILHLGDMIISGEGDGPLAPLPKEQHMILFSENAVEFDCILTKIMGFDYKKFKGLEKAIRSQVFTKISYNHIRLMSNVEKCNGSLRNIVFSEISSPFKPASGWIKHIEI